MNIEMICPWCGKIHEQKNITLITEASVYACPVCGEWFSYTLVKMYKTLREDLHGSY